MAKLEIEDFKVFRTLEGKPLPEGDWMIVTQEMINDFAKATGDHQWIHVDVEKATKYSPFKKPVAHGFMSISMLSKMLEDLISVKSVKMGVNYGLNKVRFPSPVLVDSRLRLVGNIANIEEYGDNGLKVTWNCTVEIEGSEKPACVAEFISLMFS
ncbi:MaoC family dehydratase [Maribacter forsetii]|uniref:MaoC family dehydratase n=1 Tax=Maribacter forsetii TaxID=444515 RepID=UPI0005695EA7|nr:MaoC family dehydratase [Maribacter forsetii]